MGRLCTNMRNAAIIGGSCLLLLYSLISASSLQAQTSILFETIEPSFSPEITFDTNSASFVWTWADSSINSDYPVATTSASPGLQALTVSSAGALTGLNLGFDGGDSGWTNHFTMRDEQGVAAILFSAPLTNLQLFAASHNPITNTLDFSGFSSLQDIECFDCTNV